MPDYNFMDLGLDDMRKRLRGAGLDENDAEMGTLAMAPKLYRDRQERLGGLANFAFTGQAPGQGQKEIDLSFGYNPKPSETLQIQNPVAEVWKQQAQQPAAELQPWEDPDQEERSPYLLEPQQEAPKAPTFTPGTSAPAAFQKTYAQAPAATGAASGSTLADIIAQQVRKMDYRPYQPGMSAADDQALNGPPILGRQEKIGVVRGPGNIADAMGFASWRANNPGGTAEEFYARRGYDAAAPAGGAAPSNVVRRAQLGDVNAKNDLWQMVGQDRGAYARAISGGAMPFQIEDEARAQARDAHELALERVRHEMLSKDRGFYEGQRQFDARQGMEGARLELAKQQQQDEADYKRGLISNAELAQRTAQRKQMADEMYQQGQLNMAANDPRRGLDQLTLDAMKRIQSGQGTPADYQIAKMEMPGGTGQADTEDFDRFASMATTYGTEEAAKLINARRAAQGKPPLQFPGGEMKTLAEKNMEGQNLRAAQAEYRNAVNTGRDPAQAAQEISLRTGVTAEQLGTAAPGMETGDIGAALSRFGYQNVDQAFQAAARRAGQRDPAFGQKLMSIIGPTPDPMTAIKSNPQAMALVKQAVQMELARMKMPPAFAQQVAAAGTF